MEFSIHPFSRKDLAWTAPDAPEKLFIQGTIQALHLLKSLPERGLAIVGTRNPQPRSLAIVKKTIQGLANSGLIIISGMARGIDAAAHWAAIEARMPTVAVLGAGLDLTYPRENQLLREKILMSGGLIISEYALGTPALGHHFLRRNRIIAGFSQATWVVEAGFRSGALSTARWAREFDRTCFTVPCFPGDPALQGNQTLLDRDHALAFWGPHSFGATWIELATYQPIETRNVPPATELVKHVNLLTFQKGGAPVDEVLNWALSQDWTPGDFFAAMRSAIEQKLLIEHRGVLVSNQS